MEVYKANGSHTLVQCLPQVLDMAPEGPWQKQGIISLCCISPKNPYFGFTLLLYCIFSYRTDSETFLKQMSEVSLWGFRTKCYQVGVPTV